MEQHRSSKKNAKIMMGLIQPPAYHFEWVGTSLDSRHRPRRKGRIRKRCHDQEKFFMMMLIVSYVAYYTVEGFVINFHDCCRPSIHFIATIPPDSKKLLPDTQSPMVTPQICQKISTASSCLFLSTSSSRRNDNPSNKNTTNINNKTNEDNEKRHHLEDDIHRRLSISPTHRDISVSSQSITSADRDSEKKRSLASSFSKERNDKTNPRRPKILHRTKARTATLESSGVESDNVLPPSLQEESNFSSSTQQNVTNNIDQRNPRGSKGSAFVRQDQRLSSGSQRNSKGTRTTKSSYSENGNKRSPVKITEKYVSNNNSNKKIKSKQNPTKHITSTYPSLLPPPLMSIDESSNNINDEQDDDDDQISSGLSSWEEFLDIKKSSGVNNREGQKLQQSVRRARSPSTTTLPLLSDVKRTVLSTNLLDSSDTNLNASPMRKQPSGSNDRVNTTNTLAETNRPIRSIIELSQSESNNTQSASTPEMGSNKLDQQQPLLPSIQDLFAVDRSSTNTVKSEKQGGTFKPTENSKATWKSGTSTMPRDRVILTIGQTVSKVTSSTHGLEGILPVSDLFYRSSQAQNQEEYPDDENDDEEHDDEELPFSAEQSDAVTSDHNKIRIRRNMVQQQVPNDSQIDNGTNKDKDLLTTVPLKKYPTGSSVATRGRKMVRRGMEMLVGGVPVNADPPQRSIELFYDAQQNFDRDEAYLDWASTISLTTRDFGPLLHAGSVSKLTQLEKGLFCEYFCESAMKWGVIQKDLQLIVKSHKLHLASSTQNKNSYVNKPPSSNVETPQTTLSLASSSVSFDEESEKIKEARSLFLGSRDKEKDSRSKSRTKAKGFGKSVVTRRKASKAAEDNDGLDEDFYKTKGEFSFDIGVSREELESGEGGSDGGIVKSVFARAFMSVLERAVHTVRQDEKENFVVEIPNLTITETEDGYTSVTAEFRVEAAFATNLADMERRVKRIGVVFNQAMDDGDIALAIAAAAKEERRWPEAVRDRVVEECLFQDDDGDEPLAPKDDFIATNGSQNNVINGDIETKPDGSINAGSLPHSSAELFHGSGKDGVFFDYSSANASNSPYGGTLGLRLVEAVVERAKQRQPRIIAVGDVHGCIDELQDLLRQCDYSPGDLVVLLGDLVCKGPDSISVVQMAREIGAIGVRGNHDFEVIRWHQAIKSGVDPPVVGSEHFHIASCLGKADMKWMYSLPWFISSKDLGCLFVHAGFVSGIRLAKQNPRLMMNMRSILPDGTVTSKFFNNWPWARLWDGPQTVLFGHDADRGLQQYEHALGLDTGCVYGGRLTACILPEKRLVSVSARREYFKYRRKHYD